MLRYLAIVLLFLVYSFHSIAGIPREYMNNPAVDLVHKGQLLLPEEAHELVSSSRGHFDLSLLNPITSSDLWKDVYPLKDEDKTDALPFEEFDTVQYHSPLTSTSGKFRFNILKDGKLYTMVLSKTVHSVLLAKSLLRKVGYQVPAIKRLGKVNIRFKSKAEKKGFISYLENVAFAGAAGNWVVEDLNDDELMLQDLVVMPAQNIIYNLATGPIPADIIQGRRLLSSLIVPLTITNLSESVNMLRWTSGVVADNQLNLAIDDPDRFQATWEDVRWLGRRIEKLKRADWEEIVESTGLPKPVQMILTEKIISRRNSMMKLLQLDAKEFPVTSDVSYGVELVKGKLTQENWPGYASRFAYGDPDSPLADSEMNSWVKSRALSTILDAVVGQINQLPFLGTDVAKINSAKYQAELTKLTQDSVASGIPADRPLKAWVFPTVRGQLILSRNLVTGTYMGTDNLVQLVDAIGVGVAAGAYVGTMGLPSPINGSASGEGSFTRTYAHLRPVTSIQKALKYKFKNILVPLVKSDYGKKLHEAATLKFDPVATEEEKVEKIQSALKPFKEMMEVGESILVTDTISIGAGAQLGVNYMNLMKVSLGVSPNHLTVSRFHVHRKSEDVIQVYRDLGQMGSFNAFFSLDSLIPILKVSFRKSAGTAKTKFYSLNINPRNPKVLENLSAVRRAIVHSSTREVDDTQKPYIVNHSFQEKNPKFNLLFWQWERLNSGTKIKLTHPQGDERNFIRQYYGNTSGKNYQAYATNLVAHWMSMIFDRDIALNTVSGSNPGFSFKGKGKTSIMTYDVEVNKDGTLGEGFIRFSRYYTGWSITKDKAQKILDEIMQRYRYDFFTGPVLNDTRRLFLYNISVNMMIYDGGIQTLLNKSEKDIKAIFSNYQLQEDLTVNPASIDDGDSGVGKFLRMLKNYRKQLKKNNGQKANKYLLKAIDQAEKRLNLEGWAQLLGGQENFYVVSKIDGFREGDEDGDRVILSNSFGEFGSPRIQGPLMQVVQQTEMLEGEFFIYWLMTRLI